MGTVVSYANNKRQCFCQIKFESSERILISISGPPNAAVKIYKLLFAVIPVKTVWECSAITTGSFDRYVQRLNAMFPEVAHPLDSIRDRFLKLKSIQEALDMLVATEKNIAS
jgi:hypothetical protein